MITVEFACNDDTGQLSGFCSWVEIREGNGDEEMASLDCGLLEEPTFIRQKGADGSHQFFIGGERFRCNGWRRYVGNLGWDSTTMERPEVERLIAYLLRNGWLDDEHTVGGWLEAAIKNGGQQCAS